MVRLPLLGVEVFMDAFDVARDISVRLTDLLEQVDGDRSTDGCRTLELAYIDAGDDADRSPRGTVSDFCGDRSDMFGSTGNWRIDDDSGGINAVGAYGWRTDDVMLLGEPIGTYACTTCDACTVCACVGTCVPSGGCGLRGSGDVLILLPWTVL